MRRFTITTLSLAFVIAVGACSPYGDAEIPRVIGTLPLRDSLGVSVNAALVATFSIEMNPSTLSLRTFRVNTALTGVAVGGRVAYEGHSVSFTPNQLLDNDTLYTATILANVESAEGAKLEENFSWDFKTQEQGGINSAIQLLSPSSFNVGVASLTVQNVGANERLVIIPIHASQEVDQSFSFTLTTSGLLTSDSPEVVKTIPSGDRPSLVQFSRRHGQFYSKGWEETRRAALEQKTPGSLPVGGQNVPLLGDFGKCKAPYGIGKRCQFNVLNSNDEFQLVSATLRRVSPEVFWFVDDVDTADMSDSDLQEMETVFEGTAIPTNRKYFGEIPDSDGNGKVIVLFSGVLMQPAQAGGGTAGYVAPWDFYADGNFAGYRSNEGDIFYAVTPSKIESLGYTRKEYFEEVMPATVVHELKHLVSAGNRILAGNDVEELWIEEPSAVAAEQLAGYGTNNGRIQQLAEDAMLSPEFFRIRYDGRPASLSENFAMYGFNFLLLWRQAERLGHKIFWPSWSASALTGISNLEAATGTPFKSIMYDWALTLLLDHTNSLSGYDYQSINLRDGSWGDLGISAIPANGKVTGTVESMGYWAGQGQGQDVKVEVKTVYASPYVLIVRQPAPLP